MAVPALVLGAVVNGAVELFNRLVPDKHAQEKFKMEMEAANFKAVVENSVKQIEVNEKQAEHPSVFVAGPRPYVMWLCAGALTFGAISKIVLPTFIAFLVFFPEVDKSNIQEFNRLMLEIDMEIYITLLFGLLGLGAMRTYEKAKGIDTKSVGQPNSSKSGFGKMWK